MSTIDPRLKVELNTPLLPGGGIFFGDFFILIFKKKKKKNEMRKAGERSDQRLSHNSSCQLGESMQF